MYIFIFETCNPRLRGRKRLHSLIGICLSGYRFGVHVIRDSVRVRILYIVSQTLI